MTGIGGTGDEGFKRFKRPQTPFNAVASSDGNGAGTTLICGTLIGKGTGDDFFNNLRIVLTNGAYQGWMADIVDYDEATGTFTLNPGLGEIIVTGTRFGLVAKWALFNWILTGYDSSGINANDDGSLMERIEYIQEMLKPFDVSWIFGNMLVDADQFDFPADPADTERWTPEDIAGTEGVADIDTTTTDKLYMAILAPSMANEYAVARELPILMRHFAFQGDVDFTWGTVTGTAMRGGIMISKGATYDVQNMVRVYKEKSSGVERIVADAWFNNAAQTAVQIDIADDVLAFRIERNGDIYRCYYSVEQGNDIVWLLITQFEDPTEYMTETVSCYYDIYSLGSDPSETIIMNVDNFYLFNTFGAFADRIGNPLETQSGPGAAGSIHSKLRGIMSSLGIVAAAGTGFEVDGSGTDLYKAVVGVTEAIFLDGSAQRSIADMPYIVASINGQLEPRVDQGGSMLAVAISFQNIRPDGDTIQSSEYAGSVVTIQRLRKGVDSDWNIIVASASMTEGGSFAYYDYSFPAADWQNGDLIKYSVSGTILEIPASSGQIFYTPTYVTYGTVGGTSALIEMAGRPFLGETDAATINTLTCAELTGTAEMYEGQMVVPLEGACVQQGRMIDSYDESGKVLTVIPDWPSDPDAVANVRFTIIPSPANYLYVAGKGLSATYDLVNGIPVLTRIYSDYDIQAEDAEETVFEYDNMAYIVHFEWLEWHLDEMLAGDDVTIRVYVKDNDTDDNERKIFEQDYSGVQLVPVQYIQLPPTDLYFKVTVEQTNINTALIDVLFKCYKKS